MNIIYLEWVDSEVDSDWAGYDDIKFSGNCDIVRTFGFFVKENHEYIIVAHSYDKKNNNYVGRIEIPKCSITKRENSPFLSPPF
jgi:hypothetical protein